MSYQPLNRLDSSRLPDVVEGLQRCDIILERKEPKRVNKTPLSKKEEHFADVTMAMLYLSCQGDIHNEQSTIQLYIFFQMF